MFKPFLVLLFLLSAPFVISQEFVPPHTVCYSFWEELQSRPTNSPFTAQGQVRMIPGENPYRATSPSTSNPFKNLIGSVEVSGDEETICGQPYTSNSVSACLWNGGVDEDPQATHTGWLESVDKRNCFKRLLVNKIRPTATPGTLTVVPVVDGCTMHIPSSRPDVGCRELWLTRGAFEAIGATKEEMESNRMLLEWTFLDVPS